MNVSVLEKPKAIKISSKRQITIPAHLYEQAGFSDYALCTWTDKGLLIQPLEVDDEDDTVNILRALIAEGYEGEELIAQYRHERQRWAYVAAALEEAERDVAEGRTAPADEMMARLRAQYGL